MSDNNEVVGAAHGVLIVLDEYSAMIDCLNAYKKGCGDLDNLLKLIDGDVSSDARATYEGYTSKASHFSFVGGTQPGILYDLLGRGKGLNNLMARGLPQRVLWAANKLYLDYKKKQLAHCQRIKDANRSGQYDCLTAYTAWISKSAHVSLKIALIIHAVERLTIGHKTDDITGDQMARALELTNYFHSVFIDSIIRAVYPKWFNRPVVIANQILTALANVKFWIDEKKMPGSYQIDIIILGGNVLINSRGICRVLRKTANLVKPQLTALVSEGKVIAKTRQGKQGKPLTFYYTPEN